MSAIMIMSIAGCIDYLSTTKMYFKRRYCSVVIAGIQSAILIRQVHLQIVLDLCDTVNDEK